MAQVSCGTHDDQSDGDRAPHAARALSLSLDELNRQLRLLPLNSHLRGTLITRIRDLEERIGGTGGQ